MLPSRKNAPVRSSLDSHQLHSPVTRPAGHIVSATVVPLSPLQVNKNHINDFETMISKGENYMVSLSVVSFWTSHTTSVYVLVCVCVFHPRSDKSTELVSCWYHWNTMSVVRLCNAIILVRVCARACAQHAKAPPPPKKTCKNKETSTYTQKKPTHTKQHPRPDGVFVVLSRQSLVVT